MRDETPISVVIPTWNAASFVERVLELLALQEGVTYEVIVVDNGVVNSETEEVAKRYQGKIANLRYLRFAKQLGYAGAVNAGVLAAKYSLVASINNDNLPDRRWLAELLAEYQRAKREGREAIVSSLVQREGFDQPLLANMNIFGRIVQPAVKNQALQQRATQFLVHPDGSAFLLNKEAFGLPYDEDYFIYHEDVYLGWRAWLAGMEVRMAPASQAKTFDGGSTKRIAYKTAYFTERNRWLNYFLFLAPSTLLGLAPALLLDAWLKLFFGSNRKAKLHAWVWLLANFGQVRQKRELIQATRRVSDAEILKKISGSYLSGSGPINGFFRFLYRCSGLVLGP
jgi:GT2 family glycosyltransferase